jgi:hypothetical protein
VTPPVPFCAAKADHPQERVTVGPSKTPHDVLAISSIHCVRRRQAHEQTSEQTDAELAGRPTDAERCPYHGAN